MLDVGTKMEVSGQNHAPAALLPGKKNPGTHCIGGRLSTSAYLDAVVKIKVKVVPVLSFN
jgi:hypothetical protein